MCGDHMPLFNKIFPFTMMAVIAGYPPDDQDNKSCQPVTTEVITNDATTTKPEPGFDHQTQPAKGSPAGITTNSIGQPLDRLLYSTFPWHLHLLSTFRETVELWTLACYISSSI